MKPTQPIDQLRSKVVLGAAVGDCPRSTVKLVDAGRAAQISVALRGAATA